MNCDEIKDGMVEHLYGELDAGRAKRLVEHLSSCPGCRAEWEALSEARGALDRLEGPKIRIPEGPFYRFALERAERERRQGRWVGLAGAAAAFLALGLFCLGGRLDWREDGILISWGPSAPGSKEGLKREELGANAIGNASPALAPDHLWTIAARQVQEQERLNQILFTLARTMEKWQVGQMAALRGLKEEWALARLMDQRRLAEVGEETRALYAVYNASERERKGNGP